jgi:hypothetical protein
MDEQITQINGRIDALQKKINDLYDSDVYPFYLMLFVTR